MKGGSPVRIIKGLHHPHKLNALAQQLAQADQPTVIFTGHTDYVEDILLQYTPVLFNVEVTTLNHYMRDLLAQSGKLNRRLATRAELVHVIRHILMEGETRCFQMSENPYALIAEIIRTLENVHREGMDLKVQGDDDLTRLKCDDLRLIHQRLTTLLPQEAYLTLEEAVRDLVDDRLSGIHFIVMGDDFIRGDAKRFFTALDKITDVTVLVTCEDNDRIENLHHDYYEGDVTFDTAEDPETDLLVHNLFAGKAQGTTSLSADVLTAGHPALEAMKVAAAIKQHIVDEGLKYEDFVVVTNDTEIKDALVRAFDKVSLPHDIPVTDKHFYTTDYRMIVDDLVSGSMPEHTIHTIVKALKDTHPKLSPAFCDTLDSLQDDEISPYEFRYFLDEILPDTVASVRPHDCVHVCDPKDALWATPKHVFLMGLNEGKLPAAPSSKGILLDADLALLSPRPRTSTEKMGLDMNHVLRLFTNPMSSLTLTCATHTMEGKELMPSSLMNRLQEILNVKEGDAPLPVVKERLYLEHGRIPKDEVTDRITHYTNTKNSPATIKPEYRAKLGRGASVSRLETYNKCPFQYFCKYGMGVYKKDNHGLMSSELGTLCHDIMEHCIDGMMSPHEAIAAFMANPENKAIALKIQDSPVNRWFVDELEKNMTLALAMASGQVTDSAFEILSRELTITNNASDHDSPLHFNLQGFIDRVDAYEDLVRIIDYKSSAKDIDLSLAIQGFNVQMLVYLILLVRQTNMTPGAVLYFNMKKRLLVSKTQGRPDSVHGDIDEQKLFKQYKMKGYVIDDSAHRVIYASAEDSIPAGLTKNGSVQKAARILSADEFDKLTELMTDHLNHLFDRILSGDVPIWPAWDGSATGVYPCTWCDYDAVCQNDIFLNKRHDIDPQLWKKLTEEKEGDDGHAAI